MRFAVGTIGRGRGMSFLALLLAGLVPSVTASGAAFDPFSPQAASSGATVTAAKSLVQVPLVTAPAMTPVNQPLRSFSVSDAGTIVEANGAFATFRVTLNGPTNRAVQVRYSTLNGTALAGQDYSSRSGILVFTPGQTSKAVTVPIINNAEPPFEPSEFFYLVLSNSQGAQIAKSVGTATIVESSTPPSRPSIRVNDAPVAYEDPKGQTQRFTITLSRASTSVVTVKFATSDGTAKAGFDYAARSGTLTFQPGETSKTVTVSILDPKNDPTGDLYRENYFLNLSSPSSNATISRARGKGEILNDRRPS